MTEFRKGWYLLYSQPRQEKKVAEQLVEMKIIHYLPIVKTVRNWSDRVKIIDAPLFPSYIFIYLEKIQDYFSGLNTDGVVNYVRFGDQVAFVPESIVNNLRLVVSSGEKIEVSLLDFREGQILTITEGPLTGLKCEMVQHKNKGMIIVRINLLRRNILLELPVDQLVRM